MFGKKVQDFKPGDEVILENGRKVTIIAKGSGRRIGVTDGKNSQVVRGDLPVVNR